jgi:predicted enzyme related to lactoylglutathione lyase
VERLRYVIALTPDMETMKSFYRDALGLPATSDSPGFVGFDSEPDGPGLGLVAVGPDQPREVELCFQVRDIETTFGALRGRGVKFLDEIRDQAFGRIVHLRDPEGNLVSLLQPASAGVAGGDGGQRGGAAVAVQSSLRLGIAIVNGHDIATMKGFYRDRLGLHLKTDSPWWVEFEAGATRIALHPRVAGDGPDAAPRQGITIGFHVDDLITWADEARERGIHFSTAPSDEGFGLTADATDPEGYELTFREPESPKTIEEELAEAFEDDATPQHVAIRKAVTKNARAVSFVALKPDYKTPDARKKATPAAPRKKPRSDTQTVRSARGTGPAGTRMKPKRATDPKRARTRPATGRLKKAERRTLTSRKTAVATASKGKPVKRAVTKRGKKAVRKAATRNVATRGRKR